MSTNKNPATRAASAAIVSAVQQSATPLLTERWQNADDLPSAAGGPTLSVIVPTRDEAENVGPLIERISRVQTDDLTIEVIFVDDSDDGTPEAIRESGTGSSVCVSYLHRPAGGRDGGLGGAVVEGFKAARGTWACVMDGDLQHPPEILPSLIETGIRDHADIVVGTRHRDGGSSGAFSAPRKAISRGSTMLAKLVFPIRLRHVSDPMSGLFALRMDAITFDTFRPNGFKILLELLVRFPSLRVAEVGFTFGERHAGDSNAGMREGARFLILLSTLRMSSGRLSRFLGFTSVGLSGIFVNILALVMLTQGLDVHYVWAALLATQFSTVWNFMFTEHLVFSDRRRGTGLFSRLARFYAINNGAFIFRGPAIFVLTSVFGIYYVASTIMSLAAMSLVRFATSDRWIWKAG